MNDDQLLLEHLAATDACPSETPLPEEAWSRDVALAEIERRFGMKTRERPQQVQPDYRRSRGWLVAAAAFVAVLVIGSAMLFWLTRSGGPEMVDEPTTTHAPTTTSPTPTTVAPPPLSLPGTWQRVGAAVMTPIVGLHDMAETASGLVVVGFDHGEEDGRQYGVILTSADGVNWTRLAEDDPALNLGAVLMYGVTEGGPGIVAVGAGCEDDLEGCAPYPTVWTSADGSIWDRSAADPDVFGELGALADVVATEHGLVAAGGFYTTGGETALIQPTVWLSPDGIEWERVWQGEAYDFSTASVITGFHALATNADGRVVGVGAAVNSQGDFVGAIWTSTDGRTWERIDQDSEVFASDTDTYVEINDVASGPGGFVAVGNDGEIEAAVWHSPDGLTWTRADTAGQPFEYAGRLGAVDALDNGWVIAGPDRGTVTLWTSPDGLSWDWVHSIDPAAYASSVVATDSGIAVAGAVAGIDDFHAAVWAQHGFDPAAPPPDPGPPVEQEATGIGALQDGATCDEIAELGFSYAEAVAYSFRFELTGDYDFDVDGPPCANAYDGEAVSEVFGGPGALSVNFNQKGDTFELSGPAVDAELVCSTGTTDWNPSDPPPEPLLERIEYIWTCDDGSGAFLLRTDVYIDDDYEGWGAVWLVFGSGAYEGLRGGGGVGGGGSGSAEFGRLWYEDQ
jgi:hypothetical protein